MPPDIGLALPRCAGLLVVAASLIASASPARADVFLMKGGGRVTGDVVEESTDAHGTKWVHLRAGFGTIRLQKKQIKKALKTRADKNVIRLTEIVVVAIEGDVRVSHDEGETWLPLRLKLPEGATADDGDDAVPPRLGPGDRVKTADDGRGEFDIGYGCVHLESSSELAFNAAGASMSVMTGRTGVRIDESVPKKAFTVETPQASMGVRGTMFIVDVALGATTVAVDEGEVAVGELAVGAGSAVRVAAGTEPEDTVHGDDAEARFGRLRASFTFSRLEWIAVPAGKYVMGLPGPQVGTAIGSHQDFPEQKLTMPAFLMTRTELTIADYRAFRSWALGVGPNSVVQSAVPAGRRPLQDVKDRADPPSTNDEPAVVPWYDARAIAAAHGARLQSDAEWEYAYFAGATTTFSWGDAPEDVMDYEWVAPNAGDRKVTLAEGQTLYGSAQAVAEALRSHPHPVATLLPNRWGLHDMLKNVPEWCEDTVHEQLDGQPTDGSPRTDGDAETRMIRGGGVDSVVPGQPRWRYSSSIVNPYGVRMVRRIAQK